MDVVAGLIRNGDRILIAQRMPHREQPLTWEFPGGKVESYDKSLSSALARELKEELDIELPTNPLDGMDFVLRLPYQHLPDVMVHFFDVHSYNGAPKLKDHMGIVWALPKDIPKYDLINGNALIALGAFLKVYTVKPDYHEDRFAKFPATKCHCTLMDVPAGFNIVSWYWQKHGREQCTLELPDKMCWCGLLRSQHTAGHKE